MQACYVGGSDSGPGRRASGRLVLGLFVAQLAWLAFAAGAAPYLGEPLARALAFAAGGLGLGLAGVLSRPRLRHAFRAALSGVLGWTAVPGIALALSGLAASTQPPALVAHPPGHGGLLHLLAVGLLGPLCEEWLFRGLLLAWLQSRLGGLGALVASSLAFGMWHGVGLHGAVAAMVGLLLGALRLSGAGIPVCVGAHAGLNLGLLSGGLPPAAHPVPPLLSLLALPLLFLLPSFGGSKSGERRAGGAGA